MAATTDLSRWDDTLVSIMGSATYDLHEVAARRPDMCGFEAMICKDKPFVLFWKKSLWKVKSFPIWCVLEKGPNCMVTKIEEDRIPKVFWDMCFFRTMRNIWKIWQNPPKTATHLQFTRSKWTCRKANYFMQMLSWSMYFHISLWFHLIG